MAALVAPQRVVRSRCCHRYRRSVHGHCAVCPGAPMADPLAVISFDIYGTLIDVRSGARPAFLEILDRAPPLADPCDGPELSEPALVDAFFEAWEHENIARYLGPYRSYREICTESLDVVLRRFRRQGDARELIGRYFAVFPRLRRFSDVDSTLDRLEAAGLRLGVVTNMDNDLLRSTDLGRSFSLVCSAEDAGGYKPDGALFRYLLAKLGGRTSSLLHCGQSQYTDLVGGVPLGVQVAWINRHGRARGAAVPAPLRELPDLTGVPDLLAELSAARARHLAGQGLSQGPGA